MEIGRGEESRGMQRGRGERKNEGEGMERGRGGRERGRERER